MRISKVLVLSIAALAVGVGCNKKSADEPAAPAAKPAAAAADQKGQPAPGQPAPGQPAAGEGQAQPAGEAGGNPAQQQGGGGTPGDAASETVASNVTPVLRILSGATKSRPLYFTAVLPVVGGEGKFHGEAQLKQGGQLAQAEMTAETKATKGEVLAWVQYVAGSKGAKTATTLVYLKERTNPKETLLGEMPGDVYLFTRDRNEVGDMTLVMRASNMSRDEAIAVHNKLHRLHDGPYSESEIEAARQSLKK